MAKAEGIVGYLRKAAHETKRSLLATSPDNKSGQQRIFSILDYIEQPWGLSMKLYPAQRFLVKLFYFLPLDETLPEDSDRRIRIPDMFNTKTLYEFTEREYLTYLYNEGRCNIKEQDHERRELILAIGRRAGKCCREGTYIPTHNGFFRIEELGDPNGPEYQPLQVGVAQEGPCKATSAFFYNGGTKDTIRVRSRCGYEIEGTPNHRVRVMSEDGTIQWRLLGDLKAGDYLGIHRKTNLWATSVCPTVNQFPPGRKKVSLPEYLDESWSTLLGVLVGDGSWNYPSMLEVTVGPYPDWLTQVEGLFQQTLGKVTVFQEPGRERVSRVRCYSVQARRFFDSLGYTIGVQSDEKRIPWVIWRSPKPVVAAFLRGLFETDGSVERGGRIVSFSTASSKLASEVQLLLLNFGIISRVKHRLNKKYGKTYYHLTLLGSGSIRIFAEQIGFLSARKSSPLRAHVEKGDLGNKSATEAVPYQRIWCRRLIASVPKNNGNAAVGKLGWRRSLLRATLGNVLKNTDEDLSYPRLRAALAVAREVGANRENVQHFDRILEAGYFFDPVSSVTQSRGKVYDLTVPDGESFVANGMTNHNTTLSGVFASYEVYRLLNLYNPQAYYGLPNGNRIQLISVATDKDQAGLLFNEVTSHLAKCEYFKQFIANNTQTNVNFRTPYDIDTFGAVSKQHDNGRFVSLNGKATLRVTFRSSIAKGLRGAGNAVVILDEVAHFQDKGQSSAKDIYDAVTPSTAAFSKKNDKGLPRDEHGNPTEVESRIILISSPLGKSGKFYELFDLAMHGGEGSDRLLAIQAPTWEINPTVPSSYYKQKYHADPVVFAVEHGAQFSDQVMGWIERESDLMACVDPNLRPKERGPAKAPHQMGIDVGLVEDGTAIAITHVEGDQVILDYHEVWYAGQDWRESNPHLDGNWSVPYARNLANVERLDFDEITDWILALTKRFHITDGLFDRWNGIPLEQSLHKKGLKQFKTEFFTRDQSSKIYQSAKMFLYDQRLSLYNYPVDPGTRKQSPLIEELLTLQARQISKNLVLVEKPKKAGARDDLSDALIRSIWLSTEQMLHRKHVSHGSGVYRPHVAAKVSVEHYQMNRARMHGGFTGRTVPRQLTRSRYGR